MRKIIFVILFAVSFSVVVVVVFKETFSNIIHILHSHIYIYMHIKNLYIFCFQYNVFLFVLLYFQCCCFVLHVVVVVVVVVFVVFVVLSKCLPQERGGDALSPQRNPSAVIQQQMLLNINKTETSKRTHIYTYTI